MIWDKDDGERYWCIGLFVGNTDEHIRIDHLEKAKGGKGKEWVQPTNDDVKSISKVQILPVTVKGNCDFSRSRQITYVLENTDNIEAIFESYISE